MEKVNLPLKSAIVIFLALFLIFSCFRPHLQNAQAMGVYHLVKKNETLWSIAKAYGISVQELVRVNNITDINSIKEDSVIFVPAADKIIDIIEDAGSDTGIQSGKKDSDDEKKAGPKVEIKEESPIEIKGPSKENIQEPAVTGVQKKKSFDKKREFQHPPPEREKKISKGRNNFIWPVRGEVKSHFGIQPNKTFHNWIKIVSTAGKKVKAAESGTVIFSSNLKDYGETIIIRNKDNFATVYTHLKKRNVGTDKNVKKGEIIALLGEKDDAGEVYINFEIRLKGKAHDPLLFLP